MRAFRSPDGTNWGVEVQTPGSSNAMVVFHHPDGRTASRDRYAWYLARGPEANDVTGRLTPKTVLDALGEPDIARLFRRSMPISNPRALAGRVA